MGDDIRVEKDLVDDWLDCSVCQKLLELLLVETTPESESDAKRWFGNIDRLTWTRQWTLPFLLSAMSPTLSKLPLYCPL